MDTESRTMPWEEVKKPHHLRKPEYRGSLFNQPQPARVVRVTRPENPARDSQAAELRPAKCTTQPAANPPAVSKPLSAYDDNPVLDAQGASFVLGVSVDLLKKWRQRKLGPDYIQYGAGGTVRYEVKVLLEFRDYYRVYLHSGRYVPREAHPDA